MNKKILVLDDNDLVRLGIAAILRENENLSVAEGNLRSGPPLRRVTASNPDIVILDPFQPQAIETNLLNDLREKFPALRILVLTDSERPADIERMMQQRVNGYVLKSASANDLFAAIDAIGNGRSYLHPDVSHALINGDIYSAVGYRGSTSNALTLRQEQVLRMIADGKTTQQMAVKLGLSAKTIESHRVMLMNRLGIHHIPGLVRYALRHGYASLAAANDS